MMGTVSGEYEVPFCGNLASLIKIILKLIGEKLKNIFITILEKNNTASKLNVPAATRRRKNEKPHVFKVSHAGR